MRKVRWFSSCPAACAARRVLLLSPGSAGAWRRGRAPASAREQGDATEVPPEHLVPLTSAHERLNRWYDDYLFEGMTQRLAEMADG